MNQTLKVLSHLSDALDQFDELCVDEFAEAVALILRTGYGQHNYESFINTLNKHLYPHGK
jgi:hypothetical protein